MIFHRSDLLSLTTAGRFGVPRFFQGGAGYGVLRPLVNSF